MEDSSEDDLNGYSSEDSDLDSDSSEDTDEADSAVYDLTLVYENLDRHTKLNLNKPHIIHWILDNIDFFVMKSRGNESITEVALYPHLVDGHQDDDAWENSVRPLAIFRSSRGSIYVLPTTVMTVIVIMIIILVPLCVSLTGMY